MSPQGKYLNKVSSLIVQKKNMISLFDTHFRLISQKLLLLFSKQMLQLSSKIRILSTKISDLQSKCKYYSHELIPNEHKSIKKQLLKVLGENNKKYLHI